MSPSPDTPRRTFIDLFSGAGGMTYGFHAHPAFRVVAAFDGEFGKPSSGPGSLGCNETFKLNVGVAPTMVDLSTVEDDYIQTVRRELLDDSDLDVLSACPPRAPESRGFAGTRERTPLKTSIDV